MLGEILKERMDLLSINSQELSNKVFMEEESLIKIIDGTMSLADIDEFDLDMIASALKTKKEYFYDESFRKSDFIISSHNRGAESKESIKVKLFLQEFIDNLLFIEEIERSEGILDVQH